MENLNGNAILSIYGREYVNKGDKAVLLLNLGSPASPQKKDVALYLEKFLMDKRVISLPYPFRYLLVKGIIVPFRSKYSARNYAKIWDEESQSFPLLRYTAAMAKKLSDKTKSCVAIAMRYGEPNVEETLKQLHKIGIRKLKIIALYPHYSRSSFESAQVDAIEKARAWGFEIETTEAFYLNAKYREALADTVRPYLNQDFDKLIISMHSIPLSHLKKDCRKENSNTSYCLSREHNEEDKKTCYRLHCEEAAELLRQDLGLNKDKVELLYQSRLGKHEWLRPYFVDRIRLLASEGAKKILVICPGFVCDCLETLEEIKTEYKQIFFEHGGESFTYIPCLNDSDGMINFLESLIEE